MDRFAAMIMLLGTLVSLVLILLAFFSVAPIVCSSIVVLLYFLYLFMAYEESGFHHAQEFENRFWTTFAVMLSSVLFFAKDSPVAFGLYWSPSWGVVAVVVSGYLMHVWDRYTHRVAISAQPGAHMLRRMANASSSNLVSQSLLHLRDLGIPVEAQLEKINECLKEIDQLLIPSTINNFINLRYVQAKEREIIAIFEDCDARALNFLIGHVKLGLLFYKVKDHRNFHGKHRTELINLLAVERLSILTVMSRVILLHSLQLLKLRANPRAEFWVRYILVNTHQDDLSELKTLTDAKGDYFCMNKLVYDDIKSESVRQDILHHIRREAAIQQTHWQMGTRRKKRLTNRPQMTWRKVLSDVDDTLSSSGGMYPAGIDKRFSRKTIYPGVLAFYRELDMGTQGPEEWGSDRVGNLVFLSARPHVYKDMSEKQNFAKFEKLRAVKDDGRKGMHTTPSLLVGDLASGGQYVVTNDMEPLARKKFDNFRRYVNLYPEYQHVFVCDNGQGDVRAGEMMFDSFPYEFEALYVHVVQDIEKTHGFNLERWRQKEFSPIFFKTYPEAALHAASRHPPLIRISGLQRICQESAKDFAQIKHWPSTLAKIERREELNQAIWKANDFLNWHGSDVVELIQAERDWEDGDKVTTMYGSGTVCGFDPNHDLYDLILDWSPLDQQMSAHEKVGQHPVTTAQSLDADRQTASLATVHETDEVEDISEEDESPTSVAACSEQEIEPVAMEEQEGGQSSAEGQDTSSTSQASRQTVSEREVAPLRIKRSPMIVKARVRGKFLSKFIPPSLPKLDKPTSSLFAFFAADKKESTRQVSFAKGDKCTTPYGPGTVVEHREDKIVVVDMLGWPAQAFLHEGTVSPLSRNLLMNLIRQFSTDGQPQPKPLEFPYATGTIVRTPFGDGVVEKPLSVESTSPSSLPPTIGISLESWTLSDGFHPTVFCTVDTARAWKENKGEGTQGIFSTLGTALVSSSRNLLVPFLKEKPTKEDVVKTFGRYHSDAAAVETPYGTGRVVGFREVDGFYKIALSIWSLSNKKKPIVFVRGVDLRCHTAPGCTEGYPVLTTYGLSGILASVDPKSGVHIVTVPSCGIVCYLQPEYIVQALKAAVGEHVVTMFGEGKVVGYNKSSEIYTITLSWNATLYAKADTFDRMGEGVQDRDGPFGVNWLLRMLFFSSSKASHSAPVSRSRSNSIVSASAKSQKSLA